MDHRLLRMRVALLVANCIFSGCESVFVCTLDGDVSYVDIIYLIKPVDNKDISIHRRYIGGSVGYCNY